MKVTYLDQLHWIDLSRAAYGLDSPPEIPRVLEVLRQAKASGRVCFPLSYAHYRETWKQSDVERRHRLAKFMWELSGGMAVAPPDVVIAHEIEVALARYFPGRVVPETLQLLGRGWVHAFNAFPAPLRPAVEAFLGPEGELSYLGGDWPTRGSRINLTADRGFKKSIDLWAGAGSQFSEKEFEQEIYATNLSDIDIPLQKALTRNHISSDEFAQFDILSRRDFLEDMPWQRAEMHLKRQWAKDRDLKGKDSDLIDWGVLSLAVSYCDIVATEKQKASLFSRARGFNTRAIVITQLSQLPELVA